MVDDFMSWVRANEESFRSAPICAKIIRGEIKDETMIPPLHKGGLTVTSQDLIVTFTVWDTGMCEIIAMDTRAAEEPIVLVDRHFENAAEMLSVVARYSNLIREGASPESLKSVM